MPEKARALLPVIAVIAVIGAVPGSSSADENPFGRCPDGYAPVAFIAPDQDRNGNGIVCVKPSPNGILLHDDPSGRPYRCNGINPVEVALCEATTFDDANALVQDDIVD